MKNPSDQLVTHAWRRQRTARRVAVDDSHPADEHQGEPCWPGDATAGNDRSESALRTQTTLGYRLQQEDEECDDESQQDRAHLPGITHPSGLAPNVREHRAAYCESHNKWDERLVAHPVLAQAHLGPRPPRIAQVLQNDLMGRFAGRARWVEAPELHGLSHPRSRLGR
jgi:hypothetical protein